MQTVIGLKGRKIMKIELNKYMSKKIVKNISETDQALVDIGIVKVGETIEVDIDFNNANFEETKKEVEKPKKEIKKEE